MTVVEFRVTPVMMMFSRINQFINCIGGISVLSRISQSFFSRIVFLVEVLNRFHVDKGTK